MSAEVDVVGCPAPSFFDVLEGQSRLFQERRRTASPPGCGDDKRQVPEALAVLTGVVVGDKGDRT